MFSKHALGFLLLLVLLLPVNAAEAAGRLPKGAKNMEPVVVRKIYNARTWVWSTGGGYFANNRSFLAVSGKGRSLTVAKGRWLVTRGGRICFVADWTDRKATYKGSRTCFNHATARNRIYQSKGMSGDWYVFKSSPPKRSDEIRKIRKGNLIAKKWARAARKLGVKP